jgi:hypothetical protein
MRRWAKLDENNIVIALTASDVVQPNKAEVIADLPSYEIIGKEYVNPNTLIVPEQQIIDEALEWRNSELLRTDALVLLPDYPDTNSLLIYRQSLRDWPDTSDFPSAKPELGV